MLVNKRLPQKGNLFFLIKILRKRLFDYFGYWRCGGILALKFNRIANVQFCKNAQPKLFPQHIAKYLLGCRFFSVGRFYRPYFSLGRVFLSEMLLLLRFLRRYEQVLLISFLRKITIQVFHHLPVSKVDRLVDVFF